MTAVNFTSTARGQGAKPVISLPDGMPVHGQFFGQSSLSKLAVVTENCIVKVNGHMDDSDLACLAPLGCGYLTGAGTIFNAVKPRTFDKLAVLGVGAVGIAAMLAAKALGVETIIAVDIVDAKLQTALSLGATHVVNSRSAPDLETAIRTVFPLGVDKIVDTTGVTALLGSSIKALAHGGTLALVGIPPATETFEINGFDMLLSCKKVIGVIEGYSHPQEVSSASMSFPSVTKC
jgi:Zn-dependent alcohol dehydrogenase